MMSEPAVVAHGADDVWLLARRMRQHGVRRLPVVSDDGGLIGIVTLDDLIHAAANLLDELRLVAARQPHLEAKRLVKTLLSSAASWAWPPTWPRLQP